MIEPSSLVGMPAAPRLVGNIEACMPQILADKWPGAGKWDEDGWVWIWLEQTYRLSSSGKIDLTADPACAGFTPKLMDDWGAYLREHLTAQRERRQVPDFNRILQSPDVKDAVRLMIKARAPLVRQKVENLRSDPLEIHRGDVWRMRDVVNTCDRQEALPHVGIHWSLSLEKAWSFTDRDPGHDEPVPVVLTARPAPDEIDIEATFWANLHPVYGDVEQEVVLLQAPGRILSLQWISDEDELVTVTSADPAGMNPRSWRAGDERVEVAEAPTPP